MVAIVVSLARCSCCHCCWNCSNTLRANSSHSPINLVRAALSMCSTGSRSDDGSAGAAVNLNWNGELLSGDVDADDGVRLTMQTSLMRAGTDWRSRYGANVRALYRRMSPTGSDTTTQHTMYPEMRVGHRRKHNTYVKPLTRLLMKKRLEDRQKY